MEGYSGTPLARKLGVKEGFDMFLKHAPDHYFDLFSDFPPEVNVLKKPREESCDFIHLFCLSNNVLISEAPKLKPFLRMNGMIWVSWPKGASKIETDLNRERVRDFMLSEVGLVDIKVAAIDADWSGLKFVYRTKDRK
ncbi:MAG: DUF3052 domain-containing protein [Bacteroidota bacterium]